MNIKKTKKLKYPVGSDIKKLEKLRKKFSEILPGMEEIKREEEKFKEYQRKKGRKRYQYIDTYTASTSN